MIKAIIIIVTILVALLWAFKIGKSNSIGKQAQRDNKAIRRTKIAQERYRRNDKTKKTLRDRFTRPDA